MGFAALATLSRPLHGRWGSMQAGGLGGRCPFARHGRPPQGAAPRGTTLATSQPLWHPWHWGPVADLPRSVNGRVFLPRGWPRAAAHVRASARPTQPCPAAAWATASLTLLLRSDSDGPSGPARGTTSEADTQFRHVSKTRATKAQPNIRIPGNVHIAAFRIM